MMKKTIHILVVAGLIAGCGQQAVVKHKTPVIDAETVALRKQLPKVDPAQLKAVTDATNQLSVDFLREIMKEQPKDNVVFSPLSLAQDFALVYEGANGTSREQIAKLLNVKTLSEDALTNFHAAFLSDIESDKYETLKMANAIWIKDLFPLDVKLTKKLDALYGCSVKPFPADLGEAKKQMDAWVKEKTQDMIKEIKTELDNDIYAMFLNALYFDGKWQKEFDATNTSDKPFHALGGDVKVPMMLMSEASFPALIDKTQSAVLIPFLGDRYALMAIVPANDQAMKALVGSMNAKMLADLHRRLSAEEFILELPKLDLSSKFDLKSTMKRLGAGSLFEPPLDLSRLMPEQAAQKDNFFISSVIQQAKLKLDEKGVKAAAVTEIGAKTESAPMEPKRIAFDRPFLYFILHKPSGAIVLCGIVNDPTKS